QLLATFEADIYEGGGHLVRDRISIVIDQCGTRTAGAQQLHDVRVREALARGLEGMSERDVTMLCGQQIEKCGEHRLIETSTRRELPQNRAELRPKFDHAVEEARHERLGIVEIFAVSEVPRSLERKHEFRRRLVAPAAKAFCLLKAVESGVD